MKERSQVKVSMSVLCWLDTLCRHLLSPPYLGTSASGRRKDVLYNTAVYEVTEVDTPEPDFLQQTTTPARCFCWEDGMSIMQFMSMCVLFMKQRVWNELVYMHWISRAHKFSFDHHIIWNSCNVIIFYVEVIVLYAYYKWCKLDKTSTMSVRFILCCDLWL